MKYDPAFKTLNEWPDLKCNAKFVVNAAQCNLFEIQDRTSGKVVSAASKMREGVATEKTVIVFNVLSAPDSKENVREGVLRVIQEKVRNDLGAANAVLQKAEAEGIIDKQPRITWEDAMEGSSGRSRCIGS